jgi:carbamoyltransferase
MRYCGISEHYHDAGIAFIDPNGDIEFAAHSERYSKIKLDPFMHDDLIRMVRSDDITVFYEEKDYYKKKGVVVSGTTISGPNWVEGSFDFDYSINHHISHAANAFYTRPWESKEDTVILTADGKGQLQSTGIYDHNFNLLYKTNTPKSVGLFYTRVTGSLGFKSLHDEYVVMGLAAYGEPLFADRFLQIYEESIESKKPHKQLIDLGVPLGHIKKICRENKKEDVAASIQKFAEIKLLELAKEARKYGSKLVYAGGCALNVVANSLIRPLFDDMWVPTAPGDSGSALGCAARQYCLDTGTDRINWKDPYLGYNIKRNINPKEVVDHLMNHTYCGIANGRAEYGPRALGNRSLIADARYDVKDTVNKIKRRQEYRPFAPAVLEEFADQYFEGPMNEYMQYTSKALHDYKSVTHVDGTARVQIVKKDCKSIIRPILEEYYERTGVPMLLNTSLNIRGMPMVNDEKDAEAWEREYEVKVF